VFCKCETIVCIKKWCNLPILGFDEFSVKADVFCNGNIIIKALIKWRNLPHSKHDQFSEKVFAPHR
jgi:hypothetical protein